MPKTKIRANLNINCYITKFSSNNFVFFPQFTKKRTIIAFFPLISNSKELKFIFR